MIDKLTPEHLAAVNIEDGIGLVKATYNFYDDGGLELFIKHFVDEKCVRIVIDIAVEPNMILPLRNTDIFSAIQSACHESGIKCSQVRLLSGNHHIHRSYQLWRRDLRNIQEDIDVRFVDPWTTFVCQFHTDIDPYTPYRDKLKPKYFTCLNRTMRTQRVDLCNSFYNNRLFTKHKDKHISTFINAGSNRRVLELARQDIGLVPELCLENGSRLTKSVPQHNNAGPEFLQAFHDTYYDVITEYYSGELWRREQYAEIQLKNPCEVSLAISEKIYRSIYYRRPFLVFGEGGILAQLHKLGYKTFSMLVDEDYDSHPMYFSRLKHMMKENMRLVNSPIEELHGICYTAEMEDTLEYNRELLIKKAKNDLYLHTKFTK